MAGLVLEPTQKSCGECTACCKWLEIEQLPGELAGKPAGEWCEHCLIGEGCRIYTFRPKVCQEFQCAWLADPYGIMENEFRPDRCKVIVILKPSKMLAAPEGMWVFVEMAPNAAKRAKLRRFIDALNANGRAATVIEPTGHKYMRVPGDGSHLSEQGRRNEAVVDSHLRAVEKDRRQRSGRKSGS